MIGHVLTCVFGGLAGSLLGTGITLALYDARPGWWLIVAGVCCLVACGITAWIFDRRDEQAA